MNSSEHDESQETASPPSEPESLPLIPAEAPQAGQEVSPEEPAPVEANAPVAYEAPEPVLAEPGMYWCEEEYSGNHPVLGQQVHQGENDFSQTTNPEELAAIQGLVDAGVLTGPM